MSNVCCAMFNVLVKAPDDLLTKPPNLQWERFSHQVISSVGRFTSSSDIAPTDIRHLTVLAVVNFFTVPMSAGFTQNQRNTGGHETAAAVETNPHWIRYSLTLGRTRI